MNYVNKGFKLKGITIGQIIEGGMVIGIDNCERPMSDIAILTNKYMCYVPMNNAGDTIYGLKEYENCGTLKWIHSKDLGRYKNINKRIN